MCLKLNEITVQIQNIYSLLLSVGGGWEAFGVECFVQSLPILTEGGLIPEGLCDDVDGANDASLAVSHSLTSGFSSTFSLIFTEFIHFGLILETQNN